jgi:hypothetical protein
MGPIGCPETSVTNYESTLRDIPEERRSHLHGGASLKSRKFAFPLLRSYDWYIVGSSKWIATALGPFDPEVKALHI